MKQTKMVEVYDGVQIPVPFGLTPAEEVEAIARFKAEYPPEVIAKDEALYRDWLDDKIETVPVEQVLAALENKRPPHQESA